MTWIEVRQQLPNRWVVVEALAARSEGDRRLLDDVSVAGVFESGTEAWSAQGLLARQHPDREFYPLHTSREAPDIRERVEPLSRGIRVRL
jgi:hypothetical protein